MLPPSFSASNTMATTPQLRRQLGLAAAAALVAGDMLGSGMFFTPGELAPIAQADWQVFFFWALCGSITLCSALTLGELSSLIPRSGSTLHIIHAGFGPFWAFLKAWMEIWIAGPGSVAGVAIVFGEFVLLFMGAEAFWSASTWGTLAIFVFAVVNLTGIRWGGRARVVLTSAKVLGVLGLVGDALFFTAPLALVTAGGPAPEGSGILGFVRLVGLGVAAVLFTYDGWADISHVAEEVEQPKRNIPRSLALGVGGITLLYILVNYAFLRVVPLDRMQESPATIAAAVAEAAFGGAGGALLTTLIMVSIFGGLGGLVMSLPRFYYATGQQYLPLASSAWLRTACTSLVRVTRRTAAPVGAIIVCACISIAALQFFGSFSRIVNFFVVSMHVSNILMVASVFRLRARSRKDPDQFLTPGYPYLPLAYIVVISAFLLSAIFYRPLDTLIGVALTATGVPAYWALKRD